MKNEEDVISSDQLPTEDRNLDLDNSSAMDDKPLFASSITNSANSNKKLKHILIFLGCAFGLGSALFLALVSFDILRTKFSLPWRKDSRLFAVCQQCDPVIGSRHDNPDLASLLYDLNLGSWGFVDNKGKLLIDFQFENAYDFSDGLALVKAGGKWGFIGEDGKFAVNPQFDLAKNFNDGFAPAKGIDTLNQWGFINKDGKFVINPQFDDAESFSDGLAAVQVGRRWGFINRDGKFVIPPQFDDVSRFDGGLAAAEIGHQWGFINENGKFVIAPHFAQADGFSDGVAAVGTNDGFGFINKNGKFVIAPQFESYGPFSEGLAPVKVKGIWCYIDQAGTCVIRLPGKDAFFPPGSFHAGIARLIINRLINTKGEEVWPNGKTYQTRTTYMPIQPHIMSTTDELRPLETPEVTPNDQVQADIEPGGDVTVVKIEREQLGDGPEWTPRLYVRNNSSRDVSYIEVRVTAFDDSGVMREAGAAQFHSISARTTAVSECCLFQLTGNPKLKIAKPTYHYW